MYVTLSKKVWSLCVVSYFIYSIRFNSYFYFICKISL